MRSPCAWCKGQNVARCLSFTSDRRDRLHADHQTGSCSRGSGTIEGETASRSKYHVFSPGGAPFSTGGDDTRWGGALGAGIEVGFAPNWSVGVQYDHLFMQDRTITFTTPGGFAAGSDGIRQDVDVVTARINYKFGGPI